MKDKKVEKNKVSFILSAARPYSLWASVLPVLAAISYSVFYLVKRKAFYDQSGIDSTIYSFSSSKFLFFVSQCFLLILLVIFFQLSVNLFNDYFDKKSGVDKLKKEHLEQATNIQKNKTKKTKNKTILRSTASSMYSDRTIFFVAALFTSLAAVIGLFVVMTSSLNIGEKIVLLLIGLLAIFATYYYSHNKYGYSSYGFEEMVEFIFFGIVSVMGTCLILCGRFDVYSLLLAFIMGLPTCCLLIVNNIRDLISDEKAGRITLMVRIGKEKSRNLFVIILFAAEFALLLFCFLFYIKTRIPFYCYLIIFTLYIGLIFLNFRPIKNLRDEEYGKIFGDLFFIDLKNFVIIIGLLLFEFFF